METRQAGRVPSSRRLAASCVCARVPRTQRHKDLGLVRRPARGEMKYTYLWLREDGTPYYVGMGNKHRASARHRIGHAPPRERIILQDWPTEAEAREAERFLIALL